MNTKDHDLMLRCFELADEARSRGDTAVGSLLADGYGSVISEAGERNKSEDIFAHAEFLVIREAVRRSSNHDLSGYTLYSTNEPCFLCSYAIRSTSVSRVLYAQSVVGIGGATSKYPILSAADIEPWNFVPEVVQIEEIQENSPAQN